MLRVIYYELVLRRFNAIQEVFTRAVLAIVKLRHRYRTDRVFVD